MSTRFILESLAEIVMGAAVILSFVYEKRLIEFEEKIACRIKEMRRTKKGIVVGKIDKASHCA